MSTVDVQSARQRRLTAEQSVDDHTAAWRGVLVEKGEQ